MNKQIHICGLVVHCKPELVSSVSAQLDSITGVEVRIAENNGKLITILEAEGDQQFNDCIEQISRTPGVLNTALAYHHFEDSNSLKEDYVDESLAS